MKLKHLWDHDFIQDFYSLLVTEFERELFKSSLRNYCSHGNPLRFHNFAFSMRELVLQVIDRRAPNDKVLKAVWYKKEHDMHDVTRRQKLKYCAQGLLSDNYLDPDIIDELDESIKDYLKEFQFFNKYTHITEKYYKACPKQFYTDMKYIILRSQEVIKEIDSMENIIINKIEDGLRDRLFDEIVNSFPDELSILANNVIIEEVHPESLKIRRLDTSEIIVLVSGTISVTQEYGKNEDFTEIDADYPFSISIDLSANDPTDILINPHAFEIDTSSWFE